MLPVCVYIVNECRCCYKIKGHKIIPTCNGSSSSSSPLVYDCYQPLFFGHAHIAEEIQVGEKVALKFSVWVIHI